MGAHTKIEAKVHIIWIPKYRKQVLTKEVSIRVRDILRQIAIEHEIQIISGKIAKDHVHIFVSYPSYVTIAQMAQWFKGISSRVLLQEFEHLRKLFWGKHLWARGYLAVTSGTITDGMIKKYIEDQEGEPIEQESRFQIDS